jgi:Rieske Fe-S protein
MRTGLVQKAGAVLRDAALETKDLAGAFEAPPPERRELAPGEARIEGWGYDKIATYRDAAGVVHRVSAACTHLGCVVRWNAADTSWDCPCHGSRFAPDGRVLHGPAVRPLPRPKG